jgi:hypothetical protein
MTFPPAVHRCENTKEAGVAVPDSTAVGLPIEDAWIALADGLQVHRWFLHVAAALDSHPPAVDLPGRRLPLCRTEVVFQTDVGDTVSSAVITRAGQLVDHAELGYFIQLGLSRVIVSERCEPTPPRVGCVAPTDAPLELAARLLATAAANWLRLFAILGPSSSHEAGDLSQWQRLDTTNAEYGLGLAVRIRLYEAVLARPSHPMPIGLDAVRTELSALHAEADAIRPDVYRSAEPLRLIARDLLITQFPGPERFAKYQDGGGPGQG